MHPILQQKKYTQNTVMAPEVDASFYDNRWKGDNIVTALGKGYNFQ